jgi:hypothetical protein
LDQEFDNEGAETKVQQAVVRDDSYPVVWPPWAVLTGKDAKKPKAIYFYEALSLVLVRANSVEDYLRLLVALLAEVKADFRDSLVGPIAVDTLLRILDGLGKQIKDSPTAAAEVEFAAKLIKRNLENRNFAVHAATEISEWMSGPKQFMLAKKRAKGSTQPDSAIKGIALEDLRRVADELAALIGYLGAMIGPVTAGRNGPTLTLPSRPKLPTELAGSLEPRSFKEVLGWEDHAS